MTKLDTAKGLLNNDIALAIINGEIIHTSALRGVSALLSLYSDNPKLLDGSYIADRVVGKAAAMLMVLSKVREVYAVTISKYAVEVFQKYGVPYSYFQIADSIKNREGTGMCPMEQAVLDIDMPMLAYEAIIKKLNDMRGKV